jgi:hypothetical protein
MCTLLLLGAAGFLAADQDEGVVSELSGSHKIDLHADFPGDSPETR